MFEKGVSKIRTSPRKPSTAEFYTRILNHVHISIRFKIFVRIYFHAHSQSTEISEDLKKKFNLHFKE